MTSTPTRPEDAAGQWSIETVDSLGKTGLFTSVTLDASGRAHISYALCNPTGEDCDYDLKYASQA